MSHDEMCMAGYMRPDLLTAVCICPTLRHVRHVEYQRGREEAANAVAAIGPFGGCSHDVGGTCLCEIDREGAVAAARGDGAK